VDRSAFINRISGRLGRPLSTEAPLREQITLPRVEIEKADLVERFTSELESVGGKVLTVNSVEQAAQKLRQVISDLNTKRIVAWDRSRFENWNLGSLLDELSVNSINESDPNHREACLSADIGITSADYAIAETGTLVLLASVQAARSVSLTPTTHVALLNAADIVATAEDFFAQMNTLVKPSSINFITGPSRSADIENDLSIGVHGPAALYVILLG
jgi:L-lactate dehydrogenase complex protein LldG